VEGDDHKSDPNKDKSKPLMLDKMRNTKSSHTNAFSSSGGQQVSSSNQTQKILQMLKEKKTQKRTEDDNKKS